MDLNIGSFFGDRDLENMLSRVDTLVDSLSKQRKTDVTKDVADIALREVLKTIEDEEGKTTDNNDFQKMLEKLSISQERLARYSIYDELYSAVQMLKRILKVYINNVLQRDILTGKTIDIKLVEGISSEAKISKDYKSFTESTIKYFRLEEKLKDIILHHILKYGDQYIEIIDLKKDIAHLPSKQDRTPSTTGNVFFTETALKYIETRLNANGKNESTKELLLDDCITKLSKILFEVKDISSSDSDVQEMLFENTLTEDKNEDVPTPDQFDTSAFQRILLRYHKPHNMLTLTTTYSSIIGYVEIDQSGKEETTPGVGMQFAKVMREITKLAGGNKEQGTEFVIRNLVKKLIVDLITKMKIDKDKINKNKSKNEIEKEYEKLLHDKLGDDLFYTIKRLFIETNDNHNMKIKKLSVRYIPKDRIIRVCNNPIEFFPYGTSILDSLIYPGKLYLLTQLTNVVSKLSRAALIRKWVVETGPREHHSGLIQKLKKELKNQRVSVDDLMSFKSIPRILSDFKDIILLSKKGQRFVDMELLQMHDANIKVADLEDTRREIIALSGVPAPYLGYNDVIELREQLVHVNITFATEIISIQHVVNDSLTKLIDKIAETVGFNDRPSNYYKLYLRPPVVLLLQMIETIMSSITNIQQNFQASQIDFNPYYLLKRYMPSIDWDEFSKEAREFALFRDAQKVTSQTDDQGGGF